MSNSLIFRPQGGGVRISQATAERRTALYIKKKLHRTIGTIKTDDRALMVHLLYSRFGFDIPHLARMFQRCKATIYNDMAVGKWMEEKMKPHLVKPRIDSFIDYLLYNDRYLT